MGNTANVSINIAASNAASATMKQVETGLLSMGKQAEGAGVAFSGAALSGGRMDTLMGKLSLSSTEGVGRMRGMTSAMAFMGLQAVGAQGPVARLGEGLLMFGGGHAAVLLIAAALVGVGFAMKAMGDGSEEARKRVKDLEDQIAKTYKDSRPEFEKYAATQKQLNTEVEAARDAHLKATLAVIDFKNQMNDLNNSEDTQAGLQVALTKATNDEEASRNRLNAAMIASNRALKEHRDRMVEHVATLKIQAESVGLSADAVVKLQLAHEHFTPKLIEEAAVYTRLKDVREAQLALDRYYLSLSPDEHLQMLGLPGDSVLAQADRFIAAQKKVMDAREASFKAFDAAQAARARGEGPDQTSNGATGEGGSIEPPKPEVLSGVQKIAQGFLTAAGNAQTLSAVIGGELLNTVNAVGDGFINMFQAIFDGSQNAAKGFAVAMLNAVKQVARISG